MSAIVRIADTIRNSVLYGLSNKFSADVRINEKSGISHSANVFFNNRIKFMKLFGCQNQSSDQQIPGNVFGCKSRHAVIAGEYTIAKFKTENQ